MVEVYPVLNSRDPICPYCRVSMRDAWELSDSQETDCGSCLKPIHVYRHVIYTYSVYPILKGEEPNE